MSKLLKVLGVGAVTLAFPVLALAAGNLTFITFDGHANVSVDEGDSVNAKVTYDLTNSTDVESLSYELVGSDLPETCVNIQDRITDGTFTTAFDIDTTGASEGTWDVRIRLFGDNGADASNLCEDTDQVDAQTFTDRITVEDNTNDNQGDGDNNNGGVGSHQGGNSGGSSNVPSWFNTFLNGPFAALLAKVGGTGNGSGNGSGECSDLVAKMTGAQYGVYNSQNVKLQGFLLSEGMSIPALSAGASFGFYGPQTAAAISAYKSAHGCN